MSFASPLDYLNTIGFLFAHLVFFLKLKATHKLEVSNTHSSIDENLHIRIPFKRLLCSPPTFLYNTIL